MNIKRSNKGIFFAYFVFAILLGHLSSCSSSSKVPPSSEKAKIPFQGTFYEAVRYAELDFNSLYARAVIEVKGNKSFRTSADIYFVKDSLMQFSIQPFLRMEVARMELSKDSIKVVDRIHNRYFAESMQRLTIKEYPELNFYTLQSLLLNKVFIGDKPLSEHSFSRFKEKKDASSTLLAYETKKISYHFQLQEKLHPQNVFVIAPSFSSWLKVSYDSFVPFENTSFPRNIFLTSSLQNKATDVKIKYANLKIVQGKLLNVSYIPGYEKVSFEELVTF